MNNNPRVFRSIWTAVLGLMAFSLSYFLVYLVIGGIIHLLSLIPLVGRLVDWIFSFRGDSPDLMLSMLCPIISYFISLCVLAHFNKETSTLSLSCRIMGIALIVIHIISLIINLIYGDGILKNIVQIIAGVLIAKYGKDLLQSQE